MAENKKHHHPISFGVGCFNFGVNESVPRRLSVSQFVTDVKRALEAIHSINNISIECTNSDELDLRFNDPIPSLKEENAFIPHLYFFSVSFDLYIPARVQREVTGNIFFREANAERFRVFCQNEFDCPIAFIWPIKDDPDDSPSSSVVVVRKYLESEFKKLDGYVTFESLGPSPYHANFQLCPKPETEKVQDIFEAKALAVRGYNKVKIYYDTGEFGSAEDAFSALRSLLGDELDVFYEIVRTRNERSRVWVRLQEIMEDLVTKEGLSFWGQLQALRKRRRQIHHAHQQLVEFETLRVFSQQRLQKLVNDLYKSGEPEILKTEVKSKLEELEELPTSELGRLLAFAENRRSKSLEMGIVLLSSLLGGAAGSVITRFLG
ncbi:hypothetical protein [Kushneria sp. EE4]